jgi:hypothetical protein
MIRRNKKIRTIGNKKSNQNEKNRTSLCMRIQTITHMRIQTITHAHAKIKT